MKLVLSHYLALVFAQVSLLPKLAQDLQLPLSMSKSLYLPQACQDKQDVEYTILADQMNSDVKVPDNQSLEGMKAWFKNYSEVMSNLGRVMSFDFDAPQPKF
jgi:hypothetical protein